MMFGENRQEIRKVFVNAWNKNKDKQDLEPLETLIVQLIQLHPEYQSYFDSEDALDKDFPAEAGKANPFLHLGLHISIQEQLGSNRPEGVVDLYKQLCENLGDGHLAEHVMMECLGEILWSAQSAGKEPDQQAYLQLIKNRL